MLVFVEAEWAEVVAKLKRGTTDDVGWVHVFFDFRLDKLHVALGTAVHLASELGLVAVMGIGAALVGPRNLGLLGSNSISP